MPEKVEPHRTAWDAIGDLPPSPEGLASTGRWAQLLPSIPEGQNYLFHTERGRGHPIFGWRRRYWSFLLKLAKDRPSWTIPAQPGPSTGPFHWRSRKLSVREMCRLQTIPDDVAVQGTFRSAQRQIGNAVPSLLGEVLGRAIRQQFLEPTAVQRPLVLLPPDRSPPPEPEREQPMADRYRELRWTDTPHPGTGLGRAAVSRGPRRPPPPSSAEASEGMRAGSSDSRPEAELRSTLHRRGLRFRKSYNIALDGDSVEADIVFPRQRLAVFVDSCFWHKCPWHGNVRLANSTYWAAKLTRKVERDRQISRALGQAGWLVLRIWEHVDRELAADRVSEVLEAPESRRAEQIVDPWEPLLVGAPIAD